MLIELQQQNKQQSGSKAEPFTRNENEIVVQV